MPDREIILGLNFGGHDTAAALMIDGALAAACEQERFSRDKHSRRFPVEAAYECLRLAKVSPDEVGEIAFGFDPDYHIREAYLRPALEDDERLSFLMRDIHRVKEKYLTEEQIKKHLAFCEKVKFYNHHECHLASTYYPSGFAEALVASFDGVGEIESGVFALGSSQEVEIIHRGNRYPDSLGLLYSAVTDFLGWRHHCDEGIVMGLATYGDANQSLLDFDLSYAELFRKIVARTEGVDYQIDRSWITFHKERDTWTSPKFRKYLGAKRGSDEEITQHHKNVAAGLQGRLEEIVIEQLHLLQSEYKVDRLCLSGGVALNCSLNGKIEQSGLFEKIFVQPASGDAGIAIGACYLANRSAAKNIKNPSYSANAYLGSEYSDEEIRQAFAKRRLDVNKGGDVFEWTAKQLGDGKIIGWFQGRAEFGPRALGNRSILTRPYPAEMKDYLNQRVKFREAFRPFAPAILAEHTSDYFSIGQDSPHMLIACQATQLARERAPATVHVDNTSRVQTVREKDNLRFYRLIKHFFNHTGCPVVLNTSFNVKGQPIVNSPEEAIDCFLSTNIDCLVVGDFFVSKEHMDFSALAG